MRGLLAFVAWSFCISIGAASYAAEPEVEMSQNLKIKLRLDFCSALRCGGKTASTPVPSHCHFEGHNPQKYKYLIDEAFDPTFEVDFLTTEEKRLVRKFREDLKKARILDNFEFTKQHAEQCYADLQNLFEENYQPTFNIELLK